MKIQRQAKTTDGKINYRLRSTQNFEATGAAGDNLQPFSFGGSDGLLGQSTQPWDTIQARSSGFPKGVRM